MPFLLRKQGFPIKNKERKAKNPPPQKKRKQGGFRVKCHLT